MGYWHLCGKFGIRCSGKRLNGILTVIYLNMLRKVLLFTILCIALLGQGYAQTCTALGQNPSTAFPVCGTSVFSQGTVPFCGGRPIPCPTCPRGPFSDKNPFWYKFTCFTSGTLGFLITPNTPEDYDWQIFDVTGRDPNDVYIDASLIVGCNWSAEFGITGTATTGNLRECDGPGVPLTSLMPTLIAGHDYIMLVSHFTDTPNGYSLSFGGGTAVITDPKMPHLATARAICDGTTAVVTLNKRMKCRSLSANGSEFTITPNIANVIGAVGDACSGSFDMDSVTLTFDTPLPPGNYLINIKNGTDLNTLLDNCDKAIPAGENIPMTVFPVVPTPMDSLTKVRCAPDKLQLVFRKKINCFSVAADGSDFVVTGPTPVVVTGATGVCGSNGQSFTVMVQLSAPIQTAGTYTLTLVNGSDGNTIVDECAKQTPAGSSLSFVTKDTVNADFTYSIRFGCRRDTVDYVHDGRNGVNVWKWNFDNLRSSTLRNPSIVYGTFGTKTAQLIVSNGVCQDTSAIVPVLLDNELKAAFENTAIVCPGDLASFVDKSIGRITDWLWDFGNGSTSTLQSPPPQTYLTSQITRDVPIRLIVTNNLGCKDSITHRVKVAGNCYIAVPNAFTPNGDGLNDYLYPVNAYKAVNLSFKVFNRFGQVIFETRDWTKKWDGTFKGQGADPATYVWMLEYTDGDTGKRIKQKGSSILIR